MGGLDGLVIYTQGRQLLFTVCRFPGLGLIWGLEGLFVLKYDSSYLIPKQRIARLLSRTRRAWPPGAQHSLVRTRLWCGRRGWLQSPVPTSLGIPIPSPHREAYGHFPLVVWYYATVNAARGVKA